MRTLLLAALLSSSAIAATPAKKAPVNLFMGNYGYTITYPVTHKAYADFDDPGKTFEVAFFYPSSVKREALRDEKSYGKTGVVRVEVAPIVFHGRDGDHRVDLEALRSMMQATLKKRGETFTVKDYPAALPAFRIVVAKPVPLDQIVLEGKKVTYIVTSAPGNRLVDDLVKSLDEVAPSDAPGR